VFDELTSGQTVMHYSRHCLTASVSTRDYATWFALLARWSICQKLSRISSVHHHHHHQFILETHSSVQLRRRVRAFKFFRPYIASRNQSRTTCTTHHDAIT